MCKVTDKSSKKATYHLANALSHKIFSDKFRLSVLQLNQSEHATKEDIACKRVLWAKPATSDNQNFNQGNRKDFPDFFTIFP